MTLSVIDCGPRPPEDPYAKIGWILIGKTDNGQDVCYWPRRKIEVVVDTGDILTDPVIYPRRLTSDVKWTRTADSVDFPTKQPLRLVR